jgi:uncharacterized membrane protein
MNRITALPQLQALQDNTMIYAVVVFLVAILIAFLISLMIPYKGGKDNSYIKRRVAFIIVGIVACLAFYLYNDIYVKGFIMNAGFKSMFVKTNLQCLAIAIGGYIVTGLVLMFAFRHSKFGSILGKGKE